MTHRIAWLNEKGGSGKSTSALNISANLADWFGQRVLLVDTDHQANITAVLQGKEPEVTLASVLMGEARAAEAVVPTRYDNLDLLPADASLADVNVAMADPTGKLGLGREFRLKRALKQIEHDYDFVVIDTSPQRTLININVLNYVDEVFVPIDPGLWSIMGVQRLEELVDEVREHMEHSGLRIGGVLLTKVQRTNVALEVKEQVHAYFGPRVFRSAVPLNVKVEEAHSRGQSVLDYDPESAGARAYLALTQEILFHVKKEHGTGVVSAPEADGSSRSTN